jgi:hypothetical protein
MSSANVITKNRDAGEGVQRRGIAFPKGGKGDLFDIREIFEIFKTNHYMFASSGENHKL